MKVRRSTRLSRPSFKAGDGKSQNERKDSPLARDEEEDDTRDVTLRGEYPNSQRESDESRDSEGSSSDGSLDEEITFLSESDLKEEPKTAKQRKGWRRKKFKGFPIIATIKKKIRRKKNKQNEQNMNHLEIVPQADVVSVEAPEPTTWEAFMNSVAFPENQIGKLYCNFVDYVSNHEQKTESTPIIEYDAFKEEVEKRQESETELMITDKHWENFMDTIAFPEKSIPAFFGTKSQTNTPTQNETEQSARVTRAIELIDDDDDVEGEEDEQEDSKEPVFVTMFKKTKFDALGLRPRHLYGRTGIYIVEIVAGSKSSKTKLRSGMKLLTINGKTCPDSVEATIEELSQLTGYVSIKAIQDAPYSVVSSSIDDITFAMKYLLTGGGIVADSIKVSGDMSTGTYIPGDESSIGMSTYQEAMALEAAEEEDDDDDDSDDSSSAEAPTPKMNWNTVPPTKMNWNTVPPTKMISNTRSAPSPKKSSSTSKKIAAEVDYVELARQHNKPYELIFDIKKRRGEWVGLSLMRNSDWPGVYIENVDPKSKFANTQLAHGMKLVEINGKACPEDLRQAVYEIFDTNGKLELTVEDSDGLYCHEDGSVVDTLSHDDFRENFGGFLVQNLRLD